MTTKKDLEEYVEFQLRLDKMHSTKDKMKALINKNINMIPALKENLIIDTNDFDAFYHIRAMVFLAHSDCLVMKDDKDKEKLTAEIQEYYALRILQMLP